MRGFEGREVGGVLFLGADLERGVATVGKVELGDV